MEKSKKGKKGGKDELAKKMAQISLQDSDDNSENENVKPKLKQPQQQQQNVKKQKEKPNKKVDEDDEDIVPKSSKVSAFQFLAMDDDDAEEAEENSEEEEPPKKNISKQTKKADSDSGDEREVQPKVETKKQKGGKKNVKKETKKKDADDDIDAILASIEKPADEKPKQGKKSKNKDTNEASKKDITAENISENVVQKDISEMTEEELARAMGLDDEDDEKDKKKKKVKKGKDDSRAKKNVNQQSEITEDDKQDTAKEELTEAQKKKREKRERQKEQKLQEKQKPADSAKPPEEKKDSTVSETAELDEDKDDEVGESKKKKGDKKKKKDEKEDESTAKKPSKMAQAIQERLKKIEEEKEKLRKEEEEKQRKFEEALRAKEEKERLEREKKEREKQKKKARIQNLKAEGKYMTAKQKEEMRIAQQKLEALRAQGIEIPALTDDKGEAPKPRRILYDNKAKKKKPQQTSSSQAAEGDASSGINKQTTFDDAGSKEAEDTTISPEVEVIESEELTESKVEVKEESIDNVKEEWDADDVPDNWEETMDHKRDKELAELTGISEENQPEATNVESGKVKTPDTEEKESESSEESEEDSESEESESDDEDDDDEDEENDEDRNDKKSNKGDGKTDEQKARDKADIRIKLRRETAEAARSVDNLRCPIVCVLGHVDTGKTKILDKLRHTNVQDNEAGGITQQIGATNVPKETILEQTKMVKDFAKVDLKLPGLLIIDTPGHESFSNLRSRGSSLCDIAILVVDIMHGLEPQTIESINLLKKSKTPFVIALNKVDRLFQWQTNPHTDIVNTLKKQKPNTKVEFDERAKQVMAQMSEQGFNSALFYDNKNQRNYISLVPTSAHTGDGMGNLIALICELSQKFLANRLMYSDDLQATVMEVKSIQGLGTTLDVVLVNGKLREGETIIVPGTEGPIVTQIRGLLLPAPLREIRVKGNLEHKKEVIAAQGVKIIAKDLDKSIPGLPLYSTQHDDEVPIFKEIVARNLKDVLSSFKLNDHGVFVQASTLGSLEALLEFLRTSKIPYAGISIGPVHKKDVTRCSAMLEHDSQWAVIMAFDVRVEREAQELADSLGVRIFTAEIIYHLFDKFIKYREELKRQKQEQYQNIAVFPCKLKVLPQYIFNSRDPIVMGVSVEAGFVKHGTPICVPSKEFVELGRVTSIEINHKTVDKATTGQEVCIKIESSGGEAPKMYGRHFDHTDMLVSKISRDSIDAVKDWFRDDMSKADWQLIVELKKLFQIT